MFTYPLIIVGLLTLTTILLLSVFYFSVKNKKYLELHNRRILSIQKEIDHTDLSMLDMQMKITQLINAKEKINQHLVQNSMSNTQHLNYIYGNMNNADKKSKTKRTAPNKKDILIH